MRCRYSCIPLLICRVLQSHKQLIKEYIALQSNPKKFCLKKMFAVLKCIDINKVDGPINSISVRSDGVPHTRAFMCIRPSCILTCVPKTRPSV